MLAQGFVTSYGSLLAVRFLLGCVVCSSFCGVFAFWLTPPPSPPPPRRPPHSLSEAGLFPSVNHLLSEWYLKRELGIRAAVFFSAATAAGAFGGASHFSSFPPARAYPALCTQVFWQQRSPRWTGWRGTRDGGGCLSLRVPNTPNPAQVSALTRNSSATGGPHNDRCWFCLSLAHSRLPRASSACLFDATDLRLTPRCVFFW